MEAILFGSIGTLVETSEMQRKSFNLAFKEVGLDWYWNTATYCKLITQPGGMKRIKDFGENDLSDKEVKRIHGLKEEFFAKLIGRKLYLRQTVNDVIRHAIKNKIKLGFITTTSQNNINIIRDGVKSELNFDIFELITTSSDVINPKPHPDIYKFAIDKLEVKKDKALVIEDTTVNFGAAIKAGLRCILFPGEYAEVPEGNKYHTLTYDLMKKVRPELGT